jgi:hypothetical protein
MKEGAAGTDEAGASEPKAQDKGENTPSSE